MKAVVLEVKDGYAAILREDGIVEKRRGLYFVGDTIEISQKKVPAWRRSLRAAVAAVVLVGIMSAGGYSYQNVLAYSYVTLDVGETSIEYTLNRRDQVIAVQSMNDVSGEAADALRQELMRSSLPDALRHTVEYLNQGQDENGSYAHVAVTSGSDERAEKLAGAADNTLPKNDGKMDFHAETATPEERRAAEEAGMSTGRWQIREQMEPKGQGQKDFRNGNMDDLIGRTEDQKKPVPVIPGKSSGGQGQSGQAGNAGAQAGSFGPQGGGSGAQTSGGSGSQNVPPQTAPGGQTEQGVFSRQEAPLQEGTPQNQQTAEIPEEEEEENSSTAPAEMETVKPGQNQPVPTQDSSERGDAAPSAQEQDSGKPDSTEEERPADGQSGIEE